MAGSDELVGQLLARAAELERRVRELEAKQLFDERWQEYTDERLEKTTAAIDKLKEQLWNETSRTSIVNVAELARLNARARESRAPSRPPNGSWRRLAWILVAAIAALAAAVKAMAEFLAR